VKLFLDTNVVLEVLARREPWYEEAAALLTAVEDGRADGVMAAHTVTTLHYLIAKHRGRDVARTALIRLMSLVDVEPVDGEVLSQALAMDLDDFEDAVQAVCALRSGAARIVTRAPDGFRGTGGPRGADALRGTGMAPSSPAEALALLD